ncbi:MAG: DNA translocase FtsK, partial [Devosia sp.]|nr:DNA translocase FtsK [Devosia sp.]
IVADEDEMGDDGAAGGSDEYGNGGGSGDELYDKAVHVVITDKKVSTSYIQRRLAIGYNKAATLIERMEKEGVISAANHSGKREILVGNNADGY